MGGGQLYIVSPLVRKIILRRISCRWISRKVPVPAYNAIWRRNRDVWKEDTLPCARIGDGKIKHGRNWHIDDFWLNTAAAIGAGDV